MYHPRIREPSSLPSSGRNGIVTLIFGVWRAPFKIGRRAVIAATSVTDGIRCPFDWLCTDGTEGSFE